MHAIDRSRPGDTIALGARVYALTEALRPKSGTKLIGAGAGRTVLRHRSEQPSPLIDLSGRQHVEVARLTLDGASNPQASQGILATRSRWLNLHHLAISNLVKSSAFGPHGIHFTGDGSVPDTGVTDSVISDCTFENIGVDAQYGAAIRLSYDSSRNRVIRNRIHNTGRGGILCDNACTDVVIQHNVVSGSGGEGLSIEVWNHCDRAVIEDNRVDHWISVGGSNLCAVRRNDIRDGSGVFKSYGIEGIGRHIIVTDNTVGDGQQIGISVSSGIPDYCFYGYNTVRDAIQWGAELYGDEDGITHQYFYRCTFADTSVGRGHPMYPGDEGNGFRALGKVGHLVFEECRFVDNGRFGVQMLGDGVDALSFVRCHTTRNKERAVVGPATYSALEWVACQVEGNGDNSLPANKPFAEPAPVAAFDAPAVARAGEPVTFDSRSSAASGQIASLLWDFGDGPPAIGPTAVHVYQHPGTYRVTLIVWDTDGRAARAERRIRVSALSGRKPRLGGS
jgi:hypothetical protein